MAEKSPNPEPPLNRHDREQLLQAEVFPVLAEKTRTQGILKLAAFARECGQGIEGLLLCRFRDGILEFYRADLDFEWPQRLSGPA